VIFKVGNALGIFELGRDFKTILEKDFFFILSGFFLIWGSMSKNLKKDPSARWNFFLNRSYWVSQNQEFYADFKNVNIPLWQNAPKKVKIKKWTKLGLGQS
jgi:hypothetical protein